MQLKIKENDDGTLTFPKGTEVLVGYAPVPGVNIHDVFFQGKKIGELTKVFENGRLLYESFSEI